MFVLHISLLSTNSFSLDKSNILSFCNELHVYAFGSYWAFCPLPDDKILDQFKFKVFADDKTNVTKKLKLFHNV